MNDFYPFQNTPLPYSYDALEPYIDTKTMELHHDRHLQTYINKLNDALKDRTFLQKLSLTELLSPCVPLPGRARKEIRNNAGGVYNHRFYFEGLTSNAQKVPVGALAEAIDEEFGDFEQFKQLFSQAASSVFGSGYAWLAAKKNGSLVIVTTANQDTPLADFLTPILNIDVWEHAYYLKHYNMRADYIKDWFNVIDWEKANERYLQAA
ncbi:Superoxide dismutase [Mn] 2 [bioreactor metagenome]|uniref:superoxide dismutase n=1 Tax=bioreactor metagenome TaxID=1076179 RepID=A0A644XXF9_9ZZZZ